MTKHKNIPSEATLMTMALTPAVIISCRSSCWSLRHRYAKLVRPSRPHLGYTCTHTISACTICICIWNNGSLECFFQPDNEYSSTCIQLIMCSNGATIGQPDRRRSEYTKQYHPSPSPHLKILSYDMEPCHHISAVWEAGYWCTCTCSLVILIIGSMLS